LSLSRRTFLTAAAAPLFAGKKAPVAQPHILLILAENLGAWMLGCHGNREIRTPNIDLLARSGIRFLNGFVCAPAASASIPLLMTGRSPSKPAGGRRLPEILSQAGYACAEVRNDTPKALAFLDRQGKGKPFFLVAGYDALAMPPERHAAEYRNSKFETFGYRGAAPNAAAGKEFFTGIAASIARVAASVSALDDEVQALVDRLQQRGLRDSALVVFTSAGGVLLGRHGLWGDGLSSDPPNMFEEVVQVPLVWSWHGKTPPELTRPELVSAYDFLPTICDAIDTEASPDAALCGQSYLRLATNRPLGKKERWPAQVFARLRDVQMVRDSRYKLVIRNAGEGPNELYDLRSNQRENVNRYDDPAFVTVRDSLRRSLDAWEKKYGS